MEGADESTELWRFYEYDLRLVGCFHKRLCVHFEASRLFLQTILHLRCKPNQLFLEYDFCDFEVSGLFPHPK